MQRDRSMNMREERKKRASTKPKTLLEKADSIGKFHCQITRSAPRSPCWPLSRAHTISRLRVNLTYATELQWASMTE